MSKLQFGTHYEKATDNKLAFLNVIVLPGETETPYEPLQKGFPSCFQKAPFKAIKKLLPTPTLLFKKLFALDFIFFIFIINSRISSVSFEL